LLYELPELGYEEPTDIEEAVNLLRKYRSDAKIIAGGTELLNILKDRISGPAQPLPRVLTNIKK
jgi:CO/xanthine dehydrogenase FAD-binding subunit